MSALNWEPERLRAQLHSVEPGFQLEILATVDSSNSELMRRARAGNCQPTLLIAQTQSAGRGRLGRQWHSASAQQAGRSLTFSLGLALPLRDWSGLSLAVGVCIAKCLERRADAAIPALIGLKWPNDLWWQERKLAGILIETAACGPALYVVVGVGVNIAVPEVPGIEQPMAALNEFAPGVDAAQALLGLPPGNRTPTPQEAEACRPFLERQVEFVAPDLIVLLGGSAANHVLGLAEGIMRLRGRWQEVTFGAHSCQAIATLHPAYLLRTPAAKRQAWRDLLSLKSAL